MQNPDCYRKRVKIVGDALFRNIVESYMDIPTDYNFIVIQSPIKTKKGNSDLLVEIFPLWVEYYKYWEWLNHPWKIVVIGGWGEFKSLQYYVTLCQEENVWIHAEKLLKKEFIDYSNIPEICSGKSQISIFFHGHGEENIKGLLGKITDYVRNGIQMLREGDSIEEVKEIFFKPTAEHLEQLQTRLKKYQPLLEYLPWEQEIGRLKQMITAFEDFLKQPGEQKVSYDEIVEQVNLAYESISLLMKIHKIK